MLVMSQSMASYTLLECIIESAQFARGEIAFYDEYFELVAEDGLAQRTSPLTIYYNVIEHFRVLRSSCTLRITVSLDVVQQWAASNGFDSQLEISDDSSEKESNNNNRLNEHGKSSLLQKLHEQHNHELPSKRTCCCLQGQLSQEDLAMFMSNIAPMLAATRRSNSIHDTRSASRISVTQPLVIRNAFIDPSPPLEASLDDPNEEMHEHINSENNYCNNNNNNNKNNPSSKDNNSNIDDEMYTNDTRHSKRQCEINITKCEWETLKTTTTNEINNSNGNGDSNKVDEEYQRHDLLTASNYEIYKQSLQHNTNSTSVQNRKCERERYKEPELVTSNTETNEQFEDTLSDQLAHLASIATDHNTIHTHTLLRGKLAVRKAHDNNNNNNNNNKNNNYKNKRHEKSNNDHDDDNDNAEHSASVSLNSNEVKVSSGNTLTLLNKCKCQNRKATQTEHATPQSNDNVTDNINNAVNIHDANNEEATLVRTPWQEQQEEQQEQHQHEQLIQRGHRHRRRCLRHRRQPSIATNKPHTRENMNCNHTALSTTANKEDTIFVYATSENNKNEVSEDANVREQPETNTVDMVDKLMQYNNYTSTTPEHTEAVNRPCNTNNTINTTTTAVKNNTATVVTTSKSTSQHWTTPRTCPQSSSNQDISTFMSELLNLIPQSAKPRKRQARKAGERHVKVTHLNTNVKEEKNINNILEMQPKETHKRSRDVSQNASRAKHETIEKVISHNDDGNIDNTCDGAAAKENINNCNINSSNNINYTNMYSNNNIISKKRRRKEAHVCNHVNVEKNAIQSHNNKKNKNGNKNNDDMSMQKMSILNASTLGLTRRDEFKEKNSIAINKCKAQEEDTAQTTRQITTAMQLGEYTPSPAAEVSAANKITIESSEECAGKHDNVNHSDTEEHCKTLRNDDDNNNSNEKSSKLRKSEESHNDNNELKEGKLCMLEKLSKSLSRPFPLLLLDDEDVICAQNSRTNSTSAEHVSCFQSTPKDANVHCLQKNTNTSASQIPNTKISETSQLDNVTSFTEKVQMPHFVEQSQSANAKYICEIVPNRKERLRKLWRQVNVITQILTVAQECHEQLRELVLDAVDDADM